MDLNSPASSVDEENIRSKVDLLLGVFFLDSLQIVSSIMGYLA